MAKRKKRFPVLPCCLHLAYGEIHFFIFRGRFYALNNLDVLAWKICFYLRRLRLCRVFLLNNASLLRLNFDVFA